MYLEFTLDFMSYFLNVQVKLFPLREYVSPAVKADTLLTLTTFWF